MASLEAISARDIAVTGLKAQRARMNVIANNIANAETTRTENGGLFRRQLVVLRGESLQTPLDTSRFGVEVKRIMVDPAPPRIVYEPDHPDANADGYVSYPSVRIAQELVDLTSAQRAYEANIAVILSGRRMAQKAEEIIQA